jgi:branched-chain amino acid transport system permease protein
MQNKNLPRILFLVVIAALLVLLPLYAGQYTITTFIRILYFGFLALSIGFLIGQGGMVSFTQTAFFGFTGYAIGLLGLERGLAFPLPELLGLAGVLLVALLLGMVAVRAYKIVFLMITLAFGQIFWAFAQQNTSLLHGWAGIRGIRPPVLLGIDFYNTANFYWGALVLFLLGLYLLWRITKSPFGLVLNGTRESPRRMAALGYPVYWIRVVAFMIAALYAGLGGILAAYNTGIITPTTIQLSRTIWVLLMVILGGASYFWGPVVGTIVVVWLDVLVSGITGRFNTIIGIIFVITVLFSPNGLLGLLDDIRRGEKFPKIRKFLFPKASPGK